jgi:hypothetical protein
VRHTAAQRCSTFPAQEGTTRWLAHRSIARRRRAQGHGLSRGYELPRAASQAARLAGGLAQSVRHGAWTQSCLHTRSLAMPARCGRLVYRGAARGGAAAHSSFPTQQFTARRPVPTRDPRTATTAHKGMSGPGAPFRRGAAVLRRDGQHTGRVFMATRLDVARASQERDQGGGKERTAAVALTLGRQCSRGRLSVEVHVGEVGVNGGGATSAPAS